MANTISLPAFMAYDRLNAELRVVFKQFRRRQTVHAYLLTGARGLGKRTLATVLASALFCTAPDKPCGQCPACKRVWDHNEPDVLTLYADDGKPIGVDRVRDLIAQISQHAFGSGYRVVLIEPVERMTLQAQNCLLKSLEEPVANVVFLLMTHELTATLGTIASRCVRVKLTPWPDGLLQDTLVRLGHAPADIQAVLPRCGGNIGMALDMLNKNRQDDAASQFVKEALSIQTDAAAVGLSTRLKESRDQADRYLEALEEAIHQAILVRTGRMESAPDLPPLWQKAARQAPVRELNALLTCVFETRRRKAGQVNWQSNIDHLMMNLLEEHTRWQQSLA
ncbi:MAG: hypothetical protein SOZ54_06515 [Candidatus Limiplasma sp.]|nr:hypothetical protein [Candidatus Limiplasma sp.]